MKQKDTAFILNKIPYSETSTVVRCFTREHGLKSFLIQGGRKKHASVLQVMSPIEFTFYQKKEELAKMYDPSFFVQLSDVFFHPIKSSCLFFQAEILLSCVHEGQTDEALFVFIREELLWLNTHDFEANYLLHWLVEVCMILGISPHVEEKGPYFALKQGTIHALPPQEVDVLADSSIMLLSTFLESSREERIQFTMLKKERSFLLSTILQYMKIHIAGFQLPQSIEVYQTLWYE